MIPFSGSLPSHDSPPLPSTSPPTPPSSISLQMETANVRQSEHELKNQLATAGAEAQKKAQELTDLKQKHDGE